MEQSSPPSLNYAASEDVECDDILERDEPHALSPQQWSRQPVALANTLIEPTSSGPISPGPVRPQAVRLYTPPTTSEGSTPTHTVFSSLMTLASDGGQSGQFPIAIQPSRTSSSLFGIPSAVLTSPQPLHNAPSFSTFTAESRPFGTSSFSHKISSEAGGLFRSATSAKATTSLRPALALKPAFSIRHAPSVGHDESKQRITAPVGNTSLSQTGQPLATFTASASTETVPSTKFLERPGFSDPSLAPKQEHSFQSLKQNNPDDRRGPERSVRTGQRTGAQKSQVVQKAQKLTRTFSTKISRLPSLRTRQTSSFSRKDIVARPVEVQENCQFKPTLFRGISAAPLRPADLSDIHAKEPPPPLSPGVKAPAVFSPFDGPTAVKKTSSGNKLLPKVQLEVQLSPISCNSASSSRGLGHSPLKGSKSPGGTSTAWGARKTLGSIWPPRQKNAGAQTGGRKFNSPLVKLDDGESNSGENENETSSSMADSGQGAMIEETKVAASCDGDPPSNRLRSKLVGLVGKRQR